jgi:hypothetical protein
LGELSEGGELQTMTRRRGLSSSSEVVRQLARAGYLSDLLEFRAVGETLLGRVDISPENEFIERLKADPRFANGVFYGLHRDVGADLIDFRSYSGELGKGSLQLVVDRVTGVCYADIDGFNPYQDVVNTLGHLFGEMLPNRLRKWFRRRDGQAA